MEENVKKLLIQAFENDAAAWRQLALLLTVQESDVDAELCRIFLNKAIELGDEESFFVYHQLFSAGNIPVDDASYRAMLADYMKTDDRWGRERLRRYLRQ